MYLIKYKHTYIYMKRLDPRKISSLLAFTYFVLSHRIALLNSNNIYLTRDYYSTQIIQ